MQKQTANVNTRVREPHHTRSHIIQIFARLPVGLRVSTTANNNNDIKRQPQRHNQNNNNKNVDDNRKKRRDDKNE